MPRINTVSKARKDQGKCGHCGKELLKGTGYRWIQFRFGGKRKRCLEPACRFRASDLTQSDKLGRVYSAQETAEDALEGLEPTDESFADDVKAALEEAATEIREVSEEYQESCDNIREHIEESPTADECEEKAEELGSWADELESYEADDFDPSDHELPEKFDRDSVERDEGATDEQHEEKVAQAEDAYNDKWNEAREAWGEDVLSEAQDLLSQCPV